MTLYEILEVKETASDREIKRSYRRMVKIYHPDKPTGDTKKFQDIQTAYDHLINPASRAAYDRNLNRPTNFSINVNYLPASPFTNHFMYVRKDDVVRSLRDAAEFYREEGKSEIILNGLADMFARMGTR